MTPPSVVIYKLKSKWIARNRKIGLLPTPLKCAWPALKLALTVLEKTLDGVPIPGLKGSVGGILELAKTEEASIQNLKDVLELQKQVTKLTLILKRWGGLPELPPDLERRIKKLFSDLSTISTQLHDLASRGAVRRFFSAGDDTGKITQLLREFDQLLQIFQLDGIVANELATYRGFRDIRHGVKEDNLQPTNDLADAIRDINTADPVSSLPRAKNARFNASKRQNQSGCLANTRVDLLRDIGLWIENTDPNAPWMFVLQGLAGTGKSTVALSICETFAKRGLLGASFFFSRNEASTTNPFLVFPTIAYQLACQYPSFMARLTEILKKDTDIVRSTLETQLEKLVIEPFRAMADDIVLCPLVVVIDALDECSEHRAQVMSLLCSIGPKVSIPVKLFVSLRPEHDLLIRNAHRDVQAFILHDVDASIIGSDIEHFLRFRLSQVAADRNITVIHLCGHGCEIYC